MLLLGLVPLADRFVPCCAVVFPIADIGPSERDG